MASPDRMLGESPAFLQMQETISRIAPLNRPVLVIGERGTGKELVAARLHYLSSRWDQPFLKLNCAAFNENLLESQLFGHEPGAFTGATRLNKGCFERADDGTVFLDEVATTTLTVQEKLLRVTEYGEIERLGGQHTLTVDVRLIAATNEDLPQLAHSGRFREDLLDRLAFDVLTLPPLRERREDIPVLADHFGIQMSLELGHDFFPGFTNRAMNALQDYQWPGNVRELRNVVERAVYQNTDPEKAVSSLVFDPFASPWRPVLSAMARHPESKPVHAETAAPDEAGQDFKSRVSAYEKKLVSEALVVNQHNQRKTARALGLSYDQLRGLLRKYQLS